MSYELQFDLDGAEEKLTSTVLTEELRQEFTQRLHIDPVNVNGGCIDHPVLTGEIFYHAEEAAAEVDRIEDEIKRAYSQLDLMARAQFTDMKQKFTEKMIDAFVKDHAEYNQMVELLHAAKRNAGRWKSLKEACNSQRYMLVQVASNYRAEGHSDIELRALQAKSVVGG